MLYCNISILVHQICQEFIVKTRAVIFILSVYYFYLL